MSWIDAIRKSFFPIPGFGHISLGKNKSGFGFLGLAVGTIVLGAIKNNKFQKEVLRWK